MAKREKRKPKKFFKIMSFLLILVSIIFMASLVYFNILPIMYLGILGVIIGIIDLVLCFRMLRGRKKFLSFLISVIMIIIMGVGSFFVIKTAGLLNGLDVGYKAYNYSVVVLKGSGYDKIKDIDGANLGYYKTDGPETKKSLAKLAKKVETDNKAYNDINKMAGDLLSSSVDAILIENSYMDIIKENVTSGEGDDSNVDLGGFVDDTKVIYKFSILVKTSNISKDLDVTKKPFSIYVSGIDTYGSIASVSRSDVNMVVTVNPSTRQILLTSIPRDYYVPLHGKSGYNDKLTHAGLYGVDMSIQTLEDLLDVDINYYVKVNFTSVIDIVDAIGGVEVYSDYTFTSMDKYNYTKGYNKVDGKEALSFARERKAFAAGDRQRVKDQQALLEAIFRKCTSSSIITKYSKLLDSVKGKFVTNIPSDRLTALIKMQIAKNYKWTITSNSLDGSDSSNYTYSYSSQKLYVMEPIEESIDYARELIDNVIAGEKLDPTYDGNSSDVHSVTSNKATNSSSSTSNKTTTNNNTNNEGLKVSIGKASVTFDEGDTFTYYGYSATYNGSDVSKSSKVTFSINGKSFTSYQELVSYVSKLDAGQYNIVYNISYNGTSKAVNQSVTINKVENTSSIDNDDYVIDNSSNDDENLDSYNDE